MFEFRSETKKNKIIKFVDTLCKETPEIAHEMLNVPIRRLGSWVTMKGEGQDYNLMTAVEIAKLPCGCLIGATFIAACRLYPEVVDSVRGVQYDEDGGGSILNRVVGQLSSTLRVVDGKFGGLTDRDIAVVGYDVSDQVF